MRSIISLAITWLLTSVWLFAGTGDLAAQTQNAGTLKIGVLTDSSSGYADFGGPGSIEAARMAIEDFGGSVAGMKIELVSADHQNKADIGAGIARRWFDQEGVDAIVDLPNSAVALAVQSLARERQKVLLVTSALSSDLTGKACSPTTAHWTYDTFSQATVTGRALAAEGRTWFFLAADYAFGHSLARDLGDIVGATGGKVIGTARHPLNTPDFSSFLLTAQSSGAGIIALANGGADTINSIKQAGEFGIGRGNQKLAALVVYITDVHSLGLQAAQGLLLTSPFYWDQNEAARAWSRRFLQRRGMVPTMVQASAYGAVTHYLKAIAAARTKEGPAVMQKMRETPIDDFMTQNGRLREDGRVIRDMHLFQVKTPAESKYPFDYYKHIATVPGDKAFRSLDQSECPLVRSKS